MKDVYFKFDPKEWLSSESILLLPPELEGGYIRLLAYDCANDGIPEDAESLSILSRLDVAQVYPLIHLFFPHPRKKWTLTSKMNLSFKGDRGLPI